MATLTLEGLEQKYSGFASPTAWVELGGSRLTGEGWRILSVECQTGTGPEAGVCVVTLGGVYDAVNSKFLCEGRLTPGTPVKVGLGYVATEEVFQGFLYAVEYSLGRKEEPAAALVCMDVKAAMMGGGSLDFTAGKTYKGIIQGFFSGSKARGYSLLSPAPDMDGDLDVPVELLPREMDDYGFITETARRFGLECFVLGGKLLLRRRPGSGTPQLALSPGAGVLEAQISLTTAGYLRRVTVLGASDEKRDGDEKQAAGTAENSVKIAPDSTDAGRLVGSRAQEVFSAGIRDDKSAKAMAEARLRHRSGGLRTARLTLRGLPDLVPGKFVKLDKISPGLNGPVYLTSVNHRMDEENFVTILEGEL